MSRHVAHALARVLTAFLLGLALHAPAGAQGTWTATSLTNVPAARIAPAVWKGSKMIVWGGWDGVGTDFDTGGLYDPTTDTWTATGTTGAPTGRSGHTAVWTGSSMVVWGGDTSTGGLYDGRHT